jgi:hypothetical protein
MVVAGKPSPSPNYHLTEIDQPAHPRLDIKKPWAGDRGFLVLIFGTGCLAWGGGVGKGSLSTSPINFWRRESFIGLNRRASCWVYWGRG